MQITVLAENTSQNPEIGAEHGLSLYIETGQKKILFDMGQTDLFEKNAKKLGIDLSGVDLAVLSHGHYDHGGGLKTFLQLNPNSPVYLSPYAFDAHYHGREKYIGLDTSLADHKQLRYTGDEAHIDDGLTLYSCNNRQELFCLGCFGLTTLLDGEYLPDDFRHEQYLLIEENNKKILISGCSHKGILNIVDWFRPDILIGGFHFSKLPLDETLAGYAKYLNRFPTFFYTCHCTGTDQFAFMKTKMDRLSYLSAGMRITV